MLPESESSKSSEPSEMSEDSTPSEERMSGEAGMAAPLGTDFQEAVVKWLGSNITDLGHQIIEDDEIVANALTV